MTDHAAKLSAALREVIDVLDVFGNAPALVGMTQAVVDWAVESGRAEGRPKWAEIAEMVDAARIDLGLDPPAPFVGSRTADPSTSAAAAETVARREGSDVRIVTRGATRHRLLLAYTHGAMSDRAAATFADDGDWPEGTRRRASDLRAAGYTVAVGETTDPDTGAAAVTCRLTEAGRAVLDWLDAHPDAKRYKSPIGA